MENTIKMKNIIEKHKIKNKVIEYNRTDSRKKNQQHGEENKMYLKIEYKEKKRIEKHKIQNKGIK